MEKGAVTRYGQHAKRLKRHNFSGVELLYLVELFNEDLRVGAARVFSTAKRRRRLTARQRLMVQRIASLCRALRTE